MRAGLFSRPAQVNSPGNASATFGNERVQRMCPRRGSRIPTETPSVHVADVVIRDRRCGCYPCQIPPGSTGVKPALKHTKGGNMNKRCQPDPQTVRPWYEQANVLIEGWTPECPVRNNSGRVRCHTANVITVPIGVVAS